MKKLIKILAIFAVGFSLASCGSNTQKAFEEKFTVAVEQLSKADAAEIVLNANAKEANDVGVEMQFKANNIQSNLEAQGGMSVRIGAVKQEMSEVYIVDNAVYIYDVQSGKKSMSKMNGMASAILKPTGLESKAIVSIMDVKDHKKQGDGSETFTLKINQESLINLIKIAGELSDAEISSLRVELEKFKDTEILITFGSDGNFKEISTEIESEGTMMNAKLEVKQIGGSVDVKIPMLDGYEEIKDTNY